MLNYYELLGVSSTAASNEIKSAYKKLALACHPDRNNGDSAAEEKFKMINEAYQVLSDPEKRSRYDFILEYGHIAYSTFEQNEPSEPARKRPPVYPRYARFKSYEGTGFGRQGEYQVDRKYFRDLFISLGLFVLLSTLIMGFYWMNDYLTHKKITRIRELNIEKLAEAETQFMEGNQRQALEVVSTLAVRIRDDERYSQTRERMINVLRKDAQNYFNKGEYREALESFIVVRDFEEPLNLNTWYQIGMSEYKLGEFRKAAHALEYILLRDRNNISLIMEIAGIYDHDLQEQEKALKFYDDAKAIFKKFQSTSYGEAFELVMPVEDTPDIYFELFMKRAELNSRIQQYDAAVTDCNWAIFLRPSQIQPYLLRARTYMNLQNISRACEDWQRAEELGSSEAAELRAMNCGNML